MRTATFGHSMRMPPSRLAPAREAIPVPIRPSPAPIAVFITLLLTVGAAFPAQAQNLQEEVKYEARDSMLYDIEHRTVYLFGAATVTYQGIQLTAERIVLDMGNEETRAFGAPDSTGNVTGMPQFTQNGKTITADSIRYNFRSKKGMIREVRTKEDQMYAMAHQSKRQANQEVHSRGGWLTTCDRPHPHYHFAVSRMMVIPNDKIIAGPAIMKVGKVPVPLAIPFGLFPNHHNGAAGILVPTYGNSDQLGYFFLNGGYYLPINDNVDLQLTGDIYSRGSWGLRGVSHYKNRYHYAGSLEVSRSSLNNSLPEYPDYTRQMNFNVKWSHLMDPKASLTDRFNASVNVGTSRNFTSNLNSSTGDFLSNTFQSSVQWSHQWSGKPFSLSTGLTHTQNNLTKAFSITAPTVTFNVQRVFPADWFKGEEAVVKRRWYDDIGLTWSSNFDNRLSTTEDQLYLENLPTLSRQLRNGIKHTGAINTSLKTRFFSLNPELRFTDRMYFDQLRRIYDPADSTVTTDTVPRFAAPFEWSTGATLTSKLYGMFSFHGKHLKAIRHVITPTAGFSYTPGHDTRVSPIGAVPGTLSYSPFDQGIFGAPSPNASGLVSLGLIQSFEAKVLKDTAFKKMKLLDYLGVVTSYDMLRDSLNWSPLNMNARTQLFNTLDVNLVGVWDTYATDKNGSRIDRSQRSVDGQLARLTSADLAVGFELKSKRYGQNPTQTTNNNTGQVVGETDPSKGASMNFNMPWHLRVNYSYDLSRAWRQADYTESQRQSVLFNGDVTVFKWWKIGVSSGYDFEAGEKTPTTLNLYWDMHCWEMNFNIIPLGTRKSYTFRINVKASVLHDLKYELTKPFGNDGQFLR